MEGDSPSIRSILDELKAYNSTIGTAYEAAAGEEDEDAEDAPPKEPEPSRWDEGSPLNDFFEHVALVTGYISNIEDTFSPKYANAAREFLSAVDTKSAKEGDEKLKVTVKQSKTIVKNAKKSIDEMTNAMKVQMKVDIDEAVTKGEIEKKDAPNADDGETLPQWSPTYHIMYNCRWAMVNEWKRVMKAYNEEQATCERKKRENLKRQLTISNNGLEPSDEEIEARLSSGATDVFAGGMVTRGADADADFANELLEEAKDETRKLTEVMVLMREMQEMWEQFQLLLEKQGEMLNTIAGNLQKAKDFIKQANEDLAEAQEHAEAALRQQYMIIASCCIGLCVLIVPMMIGSGMISV